MGITASTSSVELYKIYDEHIFTNLKRTESFYSSIDRI